MAANNATTWLMAVYDSDLTATQKIICAYLRSHMNDYQEIAWPSIARIAAKCSLTSRAVHNHLPKICEAGFLIKNGKSPSGTIRYSIATPERGSYPPLNEVHPPLNHVHTPPEPRSPLPLNDVHPNKQVNKQLNKQTTTMSSTKADDPVPAKAIVDLYHEVLPELPKCKILTDTRRSYIRQRWITGDLPALDNWRNYFMFVRLSDFLMGKTEAREGRQPFVADLEWLSRPSNFAKVYEEKYHGV